MSKTRFRAAQIVRDSNTTMGIAISEGMRSFDAGAAGRFVPMAGRTASPPDYRN